MGSVECAVVFPEVADYPEDVIELIASTNLREKLHLVDGDLVDLKIML
jgi:CTP-dependent riboflavin kinase